MNLKTCALCQIFTDLLTGVDGKSHDIGRWSWMISTIVIAVGAFWNVYRGEAFSLRDYAEAIGIIAAAHGAAIYAKKDTEPKESA